MTHEELLAKKASPRKLAIIKKHRPIWLKNFSTMALDLYCPVCKVNFPCPKNNIIMGAVSIYERPDLQTNGILKETQTIEKELK